MKTLTEYTKKTQKITGVRFTRNFLLKYFLQFLCNYLQLLSEICFEVSPTPIFIFQHKNLQTDSNYFLLKTAVNWRQSQKCRLKSLVFLMSQTTL